MNKNIIIVSLLAAVSVFVLSTAPAFAQISSDEKTDYDGNIEEALAHIKAAEDDLDQNQKDVAVSHLSQPLTDIYSSMKPDLDQTNATLSQELQQTLSGLPDQVSKSTDRQSAQSALDNAKQVLGEARDAVVGNVLYTNIHFRVDVINNLLENSIDEYGNGVANGTIVSPVDFQTASDFIWQSQQLYNGIKSQVPDNVTSDIDARYNDLLTAYAQKIDVSDVDPMTDKVKDAVSEIGGQSETTDLSTYYTNVKTLLNQAKAQYAAGNQSQALNTVTQAYLDNFEFIEPTLANYNDDLEGSLETSIREDLRDMIKNGTSVSGVSAQIDMIQSKLDTVSSVVPEFGPVAAGVLVLAIASVVVAFRFTNGRLMTRI